MTLQERLRQAAGKLRGSSMPLADLIPLLQQTADALDAAQQERKPDEVWVDESLGATPMVGYEILRVYSKQERKPHTEAEVQRIIFCAYETFGRKGFEDVVRETLGVPAPKETP